MPLLGRYAEIADVRLVALAEFLGDLAEFMACEQEIIAEADGLQTEVLEAFYTYVSHGDTPREAKWAAMYDWDL